MGTPISPETVWNIAKYAYGLWQSCKAAKGDYDLVATEVIAMRTVLWIVKIELEDPQALVNRLDTRKQALHKQLGLHAANCKGALEAVDVSLKKFNRMGAWDKLHWAISGKDEINGLVANLSSLGTQLNTFMSSLSMRAGGKILTGLGRVEEILEQNGGDEEAAVKGVMTEVQQRHPSKASSAQYEIAIKDYAHEASRSMKLDGKSQSPHKNDRGRRQSGSTLNVPGAHQRTKSADTTSQRAHSHRRRSSSSVSTSRREVDYLECWLIQHKTGAAWVFTWQLSEKEIQPRGQCKLETMAQQFLACASSKLESNHELVSWVVRDRQKEEQNVDYIWQPYAAKMEPKGDLFLNMGVEAQAMVIIKRRLSAQAQAVVDKKYWSALAKQEAALKQARADKTKVEAAKRMKEEAAKKAERFKKAQAEKQAKIDELRANVEKLKLALDEKKQRKGNKNEGKSKHAAHDGDNKKDGQGDDGRNSDRPTAGQHKSSQKGANSQETTRPSGIHRKSGSKIDASDKTERRRSGQSAEDPNREEDK